MKSYKYGLVQTMGVRLLGGVPLIGIIRYSSYCIREAGRLFRMLWLESILMCLLILLYGQLPSQESTSLHWLISFSSEACPETSSFHNGSVCQYVIILGPKYH